MTNKIRASPKSQSRRKQDGGPWARTPAAETFIETALLSEFSTKEILGFHY
jgi:hypothetical protein